MAPTPDRVRAELKRASKGAYEALKNAGFTSGQISQGSGVHVSTVRRLGADGDKTGWRPPTKQTCAKIDEYCLTRLGEDFGLLNLRTELEAAEGRSIANQSTTGAVLKTYLDHLHAAVSVAPTWMPFADIEDGFQQRTLSVTTAVPRPTQDSGISSGHVRRGDVPWSSALNTVSVAVVIADAGYGKSWQARRYAAQLASDALTEGDLEQTPVPLWMHAAELANAWPSTRPSHAVADVATVALREVGVDTRPMQDALATVIEDPDAPCVVIVDAYDEVLGQRSRASAARALQWLCRWSHQGSGRQIVITSRAAGWDNPIGAVNDDVEPVFLYLGALDEAQVRRLWQTWFKRRSAPVPEHRLAPVLVPGSPLRQFARIPLIAAFCAWVAETQVVANTRAELFKQVVAKFLARTWKTHDTAGDEPADDDGARRAAMSDALAELAWEMTWPGGWIDAIDVGTCDAILRRRGPTPLPSRSLTFEAVRGIGILTQPASAKGERLGGGPVSWIHRTVHEFLAAEFLRTMPPNVVLHTVERAWHHPALSGVLDFALGLEPTTPSHRDPGSEPSISLANDRRDPSPVRTAIATLNAHGDDPLGFYGTLLAASGRCTRADVNRLWSLHSAGVISAQIAARALATTGQDSDWTALTAKLLADPSAIDESTFEALAWCGPPGRRALADIIANDPSPINGASVALYRIDPQAAIAAVESRITSGHPTSTSDGPCLREVGHEAVNRLLHTVQHYPRSGPAAVSLGLTRTNRAHKLLLENLESQDPAVRHAAARGLSSYYGNAIDANGFKVLVQVALHDPDPNLRLATRGSLTSVALSLPWVARAIDDLFEPLNEAGSHPSLADTASLAARLWPVGPATHKAVTMLSMDPALLRPEVVRALEPLISTALLGELDVSLTADLARLIGRKFTTAAITSLGAERLGRTQTINLAAGVSLAESDDSDVFDALVNAAIQHPAVILEAVIANFGLPAVDRIHALALRIDALDHPDRAAMKVCIGAIRRLLSAITDQERLSVRQICQTITDHALNLEKRDSHT